MSGGSSLPSWRPGATRDSLLGFLDASSSLPRAARVAAFDNDGTLWCEKPTYLQFDFFADMHSNHNNLVFRSLRSAYPSFKSLS